MTLIESEQSKDIRLTQITRGPFFLRYASYRKGEDAKLGLRSEDYIVSELTPGYAIFALCDGVGSSYYGNIGSQFLGETLLNWLGNLSAPKDSESPGDKNADRWLEELTADLKTELDSKIEFATRVIQNRNTTNQNELVRLAEKTQLEDFGTQSNFAGGVIWPKSHSFQNGLILLFWLGNARLRIFKESNENRFEELTDLTKWGEDPSQLKEVWSSKEGVVGNVYSYLTDFSKITSIIAYSDGMEGVEKEIKPHIDGAFLETLVRQAQSVKDDDVSYLEIFLAEDGNNEYSDDIVASVRRQYVDVGNSGAESGTQSEVKELREKLEKSESHRKRQSLDFQKTKKLFLFAIAPFILLATLIGLVFGYFIGSSKGGEITPTSTSVPTLTLIIPSATSSIAPPTINETLDNLPITIETAAPETSTMIPAITPETSTITPAITLTP